MGCQTPNANQAPPRVHMAMVIRLVFDNMLTSYLTRSVYVKQCTIPRMQLSGDVRANVLLDYSKE